MHIPDGKLHDLYMDEDAIISMVLSTDAQVPTVMFPVAKILVSDLMLGAVMASDMPEGADFQGALRVLRSYMDPRIRLYLPQLRDRTIEHLFQAAKEDGLVEFQERRWLELRDFFSEEGVLRTLESEMQTLQALGS